MSPHVSCCRSQRGVTDAEVARAKAQLKASLVMNLESASGARRPDRPAVPGLRRGARISSARRQDRRGDDR